MTTRTKTAVVVRDDLADWLRLDVTTFPSSGITAAHPELIGADHVDGDGRAHLPMLGTPVLVCAASAEGIATAHARAAAREMPTAVHSEPMFGTGDDADNRAVVAARRPTTSTSSDSPRTARATSSTRSARDANRTRERLRDPVAG